MANHTRSGAVIQIEIDNSKLPAVTVHRGSAAAYSSGGVAAHRDGTFTVSRCLFDDLEELRAHAAHVLAVIAHAAARDQEQP